MARPKKNAAPTYHSDESLGINFDLFPDDPVGESIIRENTMLDEDIYQFGQGTLQAGPSGTANDQSNENFNLRFPNFGNPTLLLQWPPPADHYTCSCCQVVREIIHTIVGESRKFEIHGRVGEIFHGILHVCRHDMPAPDREYQMFDFCKESLHDVKKFLFQYCEERSEAGYTLMKDPLLAFNEALNIGSDWEFGLDDEIFDVSRTNIEENAGKQSEDADEPNVSQPKAKGKQKVSKRTRKPPKKRGNREYKEQRGFVKELQLKDFVDYFHIKQDDAAEIVGVCPTTLKTLCKKEKFPWPHMKIKNLQKRINANQKILDSSAGAGKRRAAVAEIKELEQQIAAISAPYRNQ